MKNKLVLLTRKRWFRDIEHRYQIIAEENGQVISSAEQWYSRRVDMEANIRRQYNQNIVDQLNKLLEKTQRE